jgi:Plasma-membrane choline transporter
MIKIDSQTYRATEADHDTWKPEVIDYKDEVGHMRGDEDFNGPTEKRKCTNVSYFILFIICNCGLIASTVYIFLNGDPNKLTKGYDLRAHICGINELKNKKFMLYPNPNTLDWSLCVEACPYYYYQNYYCIYDSQNPNLYYPEWGCWDAYTTTAYGFYCIPTQESSRKQVLNYLGGTMQILKRSSGDLLLAWDTIVTGVVLSTVLGFCYLFLFRKAKVIKWVIIATIYLVAILEGFLVFLLVKAGLRSKNQLCGDYGPSVPSYCDNSTEWFYYGCAYVVGFLGLLYIVRVVGKYKDFGLGISMIELTCKPLHVIKELMIFPFIQIGIGLGFLLLLSMLLLWTMGTSNKVKIRSVDIPGGQGYKLEYSTLGALIIVYNALMAMWWGNFLVDFGDFVLAGGVSTWYFSRQKSVLYVMQI